MNRGNRIKRIMIIISFEYNKWNPSDPSNESKSGCMCKRSQNTKR